MRFKSNYTIKKTNDTIEREKFNAKMRSLFCTYKVQCGKTNIQIGKETGLHHGTVSKLFTDNGANWNEHHIAIFEKFFGVKVNRETLELVND